MKHFGPWDCLGAMAVIGFIGCLYIAQQDPGRHRSNLTEDILDQSTKIRMGHEWLGLYFKQRRVGFVHIEKKRRKNDGIHYAVEARIKQKGFFGHAITLNLNVQAELDRQTVLESFVFDIKAGPADLSGRGRVNGKTLTLTIQTAGVERSQSIPLKSPPALRETLGPTLSRRDLKPGDTLTVPVFDPITQRNQDVTIEIVGPDQVTVVDRLVAATHIRQTLNGQTLNAWINGRGEMLRQELGMGLTAIRETRTQATAPAESVSLIDATMIPVEGLPKNLKKRPALTLRLSGVDLSNFQLDSRRQSFQGGILAIRREPLDQGNPIPRKFAPVGDLASTILIQSDAPSIKEKARQIIGGAENTVSAAKRLMEWVGEQVEDKPVVGVPSALETLQKRVGDCNEHATLFVALARAVGIPSRIVTGLAYTKGRFGYHAWAEFRGGTGWISVDPTWRQLPVDVGHLAVLRGGLSEQARLTQLMGKLKIQAAPPE